jgi:hypothetical protein
MTGGLDIWHWEHPESLPAPANNLPVAIGIVASGRSRRTYNAGSAVQLCGA